MLALLSLLPLLLHVQATVYNLERTYAGSTFFDRWEYYNNFDNLTNGDVIFVSQTVGTKGGLTFINDAGNAVIKVDNGTTVAFNEKRNSVRLSSTDSYKIGSLWIADMVHVPFGCSVWPAWWSQAEDWPTGGEIDTFEGVNQVTMNQMALHTEPGCTLEQSTSSPMTGLVNSTDCAFSSNDNEGCVVTDPRTTSYGAGFANAGGGVFVTEFAKAGVAIWFFPRASVPTAITSGNLSTIDTSTFGNPVANYSSTGCANSFFEAQKLILDITLCGDFAGNSAVFAETCTGTCYNDWVIGSPSNYDNAYFEIKSIKTFTDPTVKNSALRLSVGTSALVVSALWAVMALF